LARKILLADDSVTAQNMGRKILTEAGYEVITVNNGSAALKKIVEQKPDIIVLDVYMPGYGGLEVCHRLKENPETSRIPVLLTVGKLEPFKVEEARRVRADMHIVKPFESTELLTAISKLEDRIVAQSDIPKKGRFAKSGLAEPAPADTFGDEQSGWKSRLIAPRKKAKPVEVKEETKPEPVRDYSSEEAEMDPVPPADWRTLLSASVAADTKPALETALSETTPAVEKEDVPVVSEEESHQAHLTTASSPEFTARAEDVVATSQTEPSHAAETEIAETEIEEKRERDHDVASALASLIPAQGRSAEPFASRDSGPGEHDTLASALSYPTERPAATGPRWVAQPTQVSDDESATLLEQEMERAYARFAASDSGMVSFAMGPLDAMGFSSTADDENEKRVQMVHAVAESPVIAAETASPIIAEPAPHDSRSEVAAVVENSSFSASDRSAEPGETPAEGKTEEVKTVGLKTEDRFEQTAPEAPRSNSTGALWLSSPASYIAATDESRGSELKPQEKEKEIETSTAPQEIDSAQKDSHEHEKEPEEKPKNELSEAERLPGQVSETIQPQAAFAAAASAGGVDAVSSNIPTPEVPSSAALSSQAQEPSVPKKEAELAAAWQSWRQIREVDVKSAPSASAPEPEKTVNFKDVANWRDEVEPEAAKSEAEGEGEEISSLVDSMLAELKPKLMKEIAKKMGKDKKS